MWKGAVAATDLILSSRIVRGDHVIRQVNPNTLRGIWG